MTLADRIRRDEGFTLVELLIAIVVGGIITGSLAMSLTLGLRTSAESGVQVMEASWAQIVGSWFLTDVHGAESVSTDPLAPFSCYALPGPEDGTLVAAFTWTELAEPPAEPPRQVHAEWWLLDPDPDDASGSLLLMRTACTLDGPTLVEGPLEEVVAQHTEAAEITCEEDSPICRIVWTATRTDAASQREDRTYEMTAVRRLGS